MFFLGNLTETDTTEGNFNTENANAILGTYSKPPIVEITNFDEDDDGAIRDDEDNPAGDYMNYDAGAGSTSQFLDSTVYYNASVLLGDGSTISMTLMVMQTQNGDTFAVDLNGDDELENQAVQSITLNSVHTDGFGGYFTSSTINGASTVCFCEGTLIATPNGEVPVEQLNVGDLVHTLDHGSQPVIWITTTIVPNPGKNAPIIFPPGSLGMNAPAHALKVSPQHRMLVRSKIAQRIQGSSEVLIAAKDLLCLKQVKKSLSFVQTKYVHFACQNHEIVYANGAEAETLLLGPMAAKTLAPSALQMLKDQNPKTEPARPIIGGPEARDLLRRHIAHERPMCCELS